MRVVVDTNVLISLFLGGGQTIFMLMQRILGHGVLVFSSATLTELITVLGRPKFDRYIKPVPAEAFVSLLMEQAEIVAIELQIHACRDPKDDVFLDAALAGKADYIVTGDEDLLAMHPFMGIKIITPATLLEQWQIHS